jgi:hypothetical protein
VAAQSHTQLVHCMVMANRTIEQSCGARNHPLLRVARERSNCVDQQRSGTAAHVCTARLISVLCIARTSKLPWMCSHVNIKAQSSRNHASMPSSHWRGRQRSSTCGSLTSNAALVARTAAADAVGISLLARRLSTGGSWTLVDLSCR